jgi:hypothetical protein
MNTMNAQPANGELDIEYNQTEMYSTFGQYIRVSEIRYKIVLISNYVSVSLDLSIGS